MMSRQPPQYFEDIGVRRIPARLMDQHFAVPLTANDLLSMVTNPLMSRDYYRPWRHLESAGKDLGSNIKVEKDKYEVNLDVQQFSPEELSVKTVDGYIVVEGKHEEKMDDHGYISRQFVRRYSLPASALPETIESKLSSDGVLTITVPKQVPEAIKGEKVVPITQTGPVRKENKDKTNPTE